LTEPAVRLVEVTKGYAGHVAVNGLSLDVRSGSVFGLLGPNGAGKTTTMRMIMDIIAPDSGSIEIAGRPATRAARRRVGYMPEERGFYPRMILDEHLRFLAVIKGVARQDAGRRLRPWIERFGLGAWAKRRVNELSKGMQQKAQFIAAILHDPDILILDEPMSGLDPLGVNLMGEVLLEMSRAGKTLILSSHQMDTVERLCDHVALINRAEKILDGSVAEVKRNHGRNAVELDYEGDGRFLAHLPGVAEVRDTGHHAHIRLAKGADPQIFLKESVSRLRVSRFELVEPRLHDIFVERVSGHGGAGQ
jgi:ABC-2 type transport system ATP-binding protein